MGKKKNCNNCFECDETIYIGEGETMCGKTNQIVLEDHGQPTDHFGKCNELNRSKDVR